MLPTSAWANIYLPGVGLLHVLPHPLQPSRVRERVNQHRMHLVQAVLDGLESGQRARAGMLLDVDLDAPGAQRQQALTVLAEVGDQLGGVEGTGHLHPLSFAAKQGLLNGGQGRVPLLPAAAQAVDGLDALHSN